jgi:hypothetical protein
MPFYSKVENWSQKYASTIWELVGCTVMSASKEWLQNSCTLTWLLCEMVFLVVPMVQFGGVGGSPIMIWR